MPEAICSICKKRINTRGMVAHQRAHEKRGETPETFRAVGKPSNHKGVHTEELFFQTATLADLSYVPCPHCEGLLIVKMNSIKHIGSMEDLMGIVFAATEGAQAQISG